MQSDDGALITVHGYARVVEGLLWVPQLVAQLRHAAFEDAAEVARDQRPAEACKGE